MKIKSLLATFWDYTYIHSFIYKNRYASVSGRGNRLLDNSLHTVRSAAIVAASSGLKPALRISASLWSFHLFLGLPTGRCPSGSASNICSICCDPFHVTTPSELGSLDPEKKRLDIDGFPDPGVPYLVNPCDTKDPSQEAHLGRLQCKPCTRDLVLSVIIHDSWP